MGVSLTIGAPQTFAVGRQSGGGRLPARHPTLKGRLKPLGVGVDHRSMQGGPRGRVVATGPGISPSAEAAQFLLVQRAGKTPGGIDSPVTGQPSQRPEGRQSGQLELAALGSTVIRDALELLQQRGHGPAAGGRTGDGRSGSQEGLGWGSRNRCRAPERRG